jgi:hypothetical protein
MASDNGGLTLQWRVGRHIGRTIYAVSDDAPDGDGVLIGVMDTPELAAEAVQAHNFLWHVGYHGNETGIVGR